MNRKPLIVEVSPGALGNLPGAVELTEQIAGIAARHNQSCIVLRPTGRGSGSVYQNYGEIDVLEAIEHVASNYVIDRDRITITGSSMGGAATWYLISHHPDLFAGAAPFCGYCDYRLWEKPGGFTFHMHEWEKLSWCSRSAAFLIENLVSYPPLDNPRRMGSSVSAAVFRLSIPVRWHSLWKSRDYTYKYTEVPKTGHGCRLPDIWEEVILWLLKQRKQPSPGLCFVGNLQSAHHNRSYWVMIDQLAHYGERGVRSMRVLSRATASSSILRISAPSPLDLVQKNEQVNVTIDEPKV